MATVGSSTVSVYRNISLSGSITPGSFAPPVDFVTGGGPSSVAIGDLDGDGKPDLVVTNNNDNTVSVLRNTATSGTITAGSFATKVDFATGGNPSSVAIGDLDGDGKPDLAVVNNASNTISVIRNISASVSITAGSFATNVDFATGTNPSSIAIGDLDGDGKPDLAVVNTRSNTVSVFRNISTGGSITSGSFATKADFATGNGPQSIAIGDLDGDGKPDLAVVNTRSNTVSIIRNISASGSITSGSFATKADFATGAGPYSIAIGDLDGDGKPDLAVANATDNTVSVFQNTATSGTIAAGSFATKVDFATGGNPSSVAIGDLDGDGKPDLAFTNYISNTVSVLRNSQPTGPIVTASGILTAFTSCSSSASTSQSFTVSGSTLGTNSLTVTPPAGFELSTTSNGTYSSTAINLTPLSGTVATTTIYARMASATTSPTAGNITVASTGATSQTVAVSGTVNAVPTISLGTINTVFTTITTFSTPYTATTASPTQYSISTGTRALAGFAAVTNATLGASPISVTIPTSAAGTYDFNMTVNTATCTSVIVPFTLTIAVPSPTIATTGTLSALSATYGTASVTGTFNVSGNFMTAGILVTPPSGFEVSLSSSSGFGSTVTVGAAGTIASIPVYIRLLATDAANSYSGNIALTSNNATEVDIPLSGTVNAITAAATTSAATSVTAASALLRGTVFDNGAATTVTFDYGTSPTLATFTTVLASPANLAAGTGSIAVTYNLSGLTVGSIYYYRVNGTNSNNTTNGSILNFTTIPPSPVLTVNTITSTSYTINWPAVTGATSYNISLYNSSGNSLPGYATIFTVNATSYTVTDLSPGTLYQFRVYSTNNAGLGASILGSVTTLAPPTANTAPATSVSKTAAVLNGTLNDNGAATTVTFDYDTSPTLATYNTVSASPASISAGAGSTSVRYNLTGLTGGTTYYYRVNGVNSVNTTNGTILSFATIIPATITATGTIQALNTIYGTASTTPASFTVGGVSLTANLLVIPPNGFEVSTSLSSGYGATISVTPTTGTVGKTTIYMRLAATTVAGIYGISGSVSIASTGVTTQTLATTASTVSKAALTITAVSQIKIYGAAQPALTATYSGFMNGETSTVLTTAPTLGTTAASASHVSGSPFTITASGAFAANYTITYVGGSLSVTTAPLTVTANNQTKVYGAAIPTLTATYSGFVNGDTQNSLTALPVLSTSATIASGVAGAPYAITANGAVDPDYIITYAGGSLSITSAPLIITATSTSKTYGTANPTLSVTYSGFAGTDNVTSLSTAPTIATTAVIGSSVGIYPITASGAAGSNYSINYVAGSLTVNPAALTITATSTSKTYGAANPTLGVTYSGFVNGDTPASLSTPASITTTALIGSSVGTYPIRASGAVNNNYNISYITGTLTVNQALLNITAVNQSRNYGVANPTLTANYSGFVNGDTPASLIAQPVISTTASISSLPGNYPITVSGASSPNYTVSYTSGTFSVVPLTNANLGNLSVSTGTLSPAFATGTTVYAVSVPNAVTNITITPTVADATATVKVNGSTVASGSASGNIALVVGQNVITTIVTAQDGVTRITYTVTVTRVPSSNANLSYLAISNGSLSPTFATATLSYTDAVDFTVGTITLTPTLVDATATIKVNGITISNGSPASVILNTGDNTVNVVVTAQDGTTIQTYTVIIHKGLPPDAIVANNILSPNGDGKNDAWVVKDIQLYPDCQVTVFDRADRKVFSQKGYANDWTGTVNGSPLAEGTYYYAIELDAYHRFTGFITIIRTRQ